MAEHTEKGTLQNKNTNENKKKELDNIEQKPIKPIIIILITLIIRK